MAKKIDGVKISVNNNAVPSLEKNKKTPVKKAPLKKAPVKKETKIAPEKKAVKTESKKKKKGGFLQVMLSVAVTALIVGGFMYTWKDKAIEKVEEKAGNKTEALKFDLEERLSNLKSKVTGVETTNVELKKTLEDFKKKAELLVGSKKEFQNEDLGFSFEYPASFGMAKITLSTVASSTITDLVFENNEKLVFAGVSESYKKVDASSSIAMKELKGYVEEGKKFYILGPNDSEKFEVVPAQIIEFDGGKALLLDKNSFVLEEDSDGIPVDIGDNVAFIFNLKDREIPGFVIINSDFSMMPLNDFVIMMESFIIK